MPPSLVIYEDGFVGSYLNKQRRRFVLAGHFSRVRSMARHGTRLPTSPAATASLRFPRERGLCPAPLLFASLTQRYRFRFGALGILRAILSLPLWRHSLPRSES